MTVKKTRLIDPDTKETAIRYEIDLRGGATEADNEAIRRLFFGMSAAGRMAAIRRGFDDLPDDLPEREAFDAHVETFGPEFSDHDAAVCAALLERAKRRAEIRRMNESRRKGGKASKRMRSVENLIRSILDQHPEATNAEIERELRRYSSREPHEIDDGGEVYVDTESIVQIDDQGRERSARLRTIVRDYAAAIRKTQEPPDE